MLRKLYLLFLIYFQLSLCYDYDSDAGYTRKKPRIAKNINRQQLGRDYYNSFRRYQNAFEDAAPSEDRGALPRLDSVNLVQKPEDLSSIDSLYLHKGKLKQSNHYDPQRNMVDNNYINDYAPNEIPRKNTMRRDSFASMSSDTEEDESYVQQAKKRQKEQHATVELPVEENYAKSMRSRFKFPFFSHSIYLNRTEDKPMKKKPSKRKIYFRIEDPPSPQDAPTPTESGLNATAAIVDNPEYLNKELRKRSYAENLCPVCRKKYLNREQVAKDRPKRSDETIHNSRQFFQLNNELGNVTDTVSNSSTTEDKNRNEDVATDAKLIDSKVAENLNKIKNEKLEKTKRDLTDLLNSIQLVQLKFNNDKQIREANEIKRHIDSVTVADLFEDKDKLLPENSAAEEANIDDAKNHNYVTTSDLKQVKKRKRSLAAVKQRLFDELNVVQSRVEEANIAEGQNNTEEHDNNKSRMKRHSAEKMTDAEEINRNKEYKAIQKKTNSGNIRKRRFDSESDKLRQAEIDAEWSNDCVLLPHRSMQD